MRNLVISLFALAAILTGCGGGEKDRGGGPGGDFPVNEGFAAEPDGSIKGEKVGPSCSVGGTGTETIKYTFVVTPPN